MEERGWSPRLSSKPGLQLLLSMALLLDHWIVRHSRKETSGQSVLNVFSFSSILQTMFKIGVLQIIVFFYIRSATWDYRHMNNEKIGITVCVCVCVRYNTLIYPFSTASPQFHVFREKKNPCRPPWSRQGEPGAQWQLAERWVPQLGSPPAQLQH